MKKKLPAIAILTLALSMSSCDTLFSAMNEAEMNESLNGITKKRQQAEKKAEVQRNLKDY